MRVFKFKAFKRFARKEGIEDDSLIEAVKQIEKGLIDADLGGGVLKQRLARPGTGKSGGYRTILFFRSEDRAIFYFGFAKNDRANVEKDEIEAFKALAKEFLSLKNEQLAALIDDGTLTEVRYETDK